MSILIHDETILRVLMATGSAVKGVLITAAINHPAWLATVHDIVKPRFQNLNGR